MLRRFLALLVVAACGLVAASAASASVSLYTPPFAHISSAPGQAGLFMANHVVANPDGTAIYVGNESTPEIFVIDPATQQVTSIFTLPGSLTDIGQFAADPTGAYLYVSAANGGTGYSYVWQIDAHTGAFIKTVPAAPNNLYGAMVFSKDGTKMYSTGGGTEVTVTDLASNTLDTAIATPNLNNVLDLTISKDGRWLYAGYNAGSAPAPKAGVVRIDLTNTSSQQLYQVSASSRLEPTVNVSPDGKTVYAWDEDFADLYVFDSDTTNLLRTVDAGTSCAGAWCGQGAAGLSSISPCGCVLIGQAPSVSGAQTWVIDLNTFAVTPLLHSDGFSANGCNPESEWSTFSADGTAAYISNHNGCAAGGGVIDVIHTPGKPGAPTGLTATPGSGTLNVSFTAPASDGNSPITDYEYSLDGGTTWVSAKTTTSHFSITGLTNGTKYSVAVRAVNALCSGITSASVDGTPAAAPTPITPASETDPAITIPAATVLSGATLRSTVSPSVAGSVTVSATLAGRKVCQATKQATTAGRMMVTCALSPVARAAIRAHRTTLKVTAVLTDAKGKTATASRNVTVARHRVKVPVTG